MKVLIDKSFEKDIKKVTDKKLLISIADCIEQVQAVEKLSDIHNCKKLKSDKKADRIKIGDYRIGFVFEEQTVIFVRFLHRNRIYTFFPD